MAHPNCDLSAPLEIEDFAFRQREKIEDRLKLHQNSVSGTSKKGDTLCNALPVQLQMLMGNATIFDKVDKIPDAVDYLLNRNYPGIFDRSSKNKIQICIPEHYLPNSLLLPTDDLSDIQRFKRHVNRHDPQTDPDFNLSHNKLRGLEENYQGDLIERCFYEKVKKYLRDDKDEEFAIFHSYHMFNFIII